MIKINQFIFICITTSIMYLSLSCEKDSDNDLPLINIDSVNIGLYLDNGAWPELKTPTKNIVEQIGLPYTILTNDSIIHGNLDKYSVLFLPAGPGERYWANLGQEGFNNIINYVNRGGGYIGICGSAYLACETDVFCGFSGEPRKCEEHDGFGFFRGTGEGPIEDFAPTYREVNCQVIINKKHPICDSLPDTLTYVYDHGPEFLPDNNDKTTIIGKTVKGKHVLILATEFHHGRIFLSSGHPEMANNETNRKLLENAIKWCSKQE